MAQTTENEDRDMDGGGLGSPLETNVQLLYADLIVRAERHV